MKGNLMMINDILLEIEFNQSRKFSQQNNANVFEWCIWPWLGSAKSGGVVSWLNQVIRIILPHTLGRIQTSITDRDRMRVGRGTDRGTLGIWAGAVSSKSM